MSRDDFWFRWLPTKWLTGTRTVSLEGRGAYADYISIMREGDGTLPDERSDEGVEWHVRMLSVRDARTVRRVVGELVKKGKLKRLDDGRLTNARVEEDMRRREGGGGPGGKGGRSKAPAEAPLLRSIEGGRSAQEPVGKPVDGGGQPDEMADSRATVARQSVDSRPSRVGFPNDFKGRSDSEEKSREYHEVVVAESRFSARARGDPGGRWA